MSSARPIRHARRAVAVSAGAFALCLSVAGPSYADPLPLPSVPSVPSPDNVITTLDQTVTQVTGTDPGLAPPPTTTPPAPVPSSAPAPAPPTTTTTTPAAPKVAARHVSVAKPAVPAVPAVPAAPAQPAAPASSVTAADMSALSLPPATSMASATSAAPAVAPLLIPQVTQRITPASVMLEADKHSGSPVRGILLTLAIAAALALGYEHGRLARQGVPV